MGRQSISTWILSKAETMLAWRRCGSAAADFRSYLQSLIRLAASAAIFAALLVASNPALAQFAQQGPKLVGTGADGATPYQGRGVALSGDGNTILVGGTYDSLQTGAVWVFARSGQTWTQQGNKLVSKTVGVSNSWEGHAVALSANGNTAFVGGPLAFLGTGGMLVFTRSGAAWSEQKEWLTGTKDSGFAEQGWAVALSSDGNTAIAGGPTDHANHGATWVFTRSGTKWTQQGDKLVGTGAVGTQIYQGDGVALSADGNTAIVGGPADDAQAGAFWVFTRSGGKWLQQGTKLIGTGATGAASQGYSVALSGDGNTAIIGGPGDHANAGATWVFTRSGTKWTQQGKKLVGTGAIGAAEQGYSVALSGDGNTAIVGGAGDHAYAGAAWVFARNGGKWSQLGKKLVGTGASGAANQGIHVALSTDGNTAAVGGAYDKKGYGAVWVFSR